MADHWRFDLNDQPDLIRTVGVELGLDPNELYMIVTVDDEDPGSEEQRIVLTVMHFDEPLSDAAHEKVRLYLSGWLSVALASQGQGYLN